VCPDFVKVTNGQATEYLKFSNIRTIRFWNREVINNIDLVLNKRGLGK